MRDVAKLLKNTTINTRISTDAFFLATDSKINTVGLLDSSIDFVLNRHIKNTKTWKLFVNQYRLFSDSANNGWRGEYWGKMMRGGVALYEYSHDEELYRVLTETVLDMLTTQDAKGRFSTYEVYTEFGNWDIWCRKYVMLGFQYYYDICKDNELKEKICKALCRHLDYLMGIINSKKREITSVGLQSLKGINSSSILEPVVRLYNMTGDKKHLDYAEYIVSCGAVRDQNIFKLAYSKEKMPYEFSVTKAYEMMSCFEGLLELYRVTGTEWYKEAVINFADMIAETDITVIGGSGCYHEFFDNSAKTQTDPTITLVKNETCVTVTWIKLCSQLLLLTGESKYADWIEKSGYNALLGAVNTNECLFDFEAQERYKAEFPSNKTENGITDNGMPFDSYSPLLPESRGRAMGGLKAMQNTTYYGCCACIGAVGLGLFANLSAVYSKDGIIFNFYNEGEYNLKTPLGNAVKFITKSEYPNDSSVKIGIEIDCQEEFSVYLRLPNWSGDTEIFVNGESFGTSKSSYFNLKRIWKNGDVISFNLNMKPIVNLQDGYASVCYGALTLARDEQFGDNLDIPIDISVADFEKTENNIFKSQLCFSMKVNGEQIKLCDYA